MNSRNIAVLIGLALLNMVRFSLFIVLLLVGKLLLPVLHLAAGCGLLIFTFCVVFRRDQASAMWAGAVFAFGATAVAILYETLLAMVAPDNFVLIREL